MEFLVLTYPKPTLGAFRSVDPRPRSVRPREDQIPQISVENVDRKGEAELRRDPDRLVAASMPIRLVKPLGVSQAPATGKREAMRAPGTWELDAVGATESQYSGSGVRVAVLDTGIDKDHPAFAGVNIVERAFVGTDCIDRDGHGTHCAGTILGRDVDGRRIGIGRGVTDLLVGKVLDDSVTGTTGTLLKAMTWALDEGAQVISMSLGLDYPKLVETLVDEEDWPIDAASSHALTIFGDNIRAFDATLAAIHGREGIGETGAVVLAAAGNESVRPHIRLNASLPSAAEGVLSVGSAGNSAGGYRVSKFSNSLPRIMAPGEDILSAEPGGGLVQHSGTSMACAFAAGVAALWWQHLAELPRKQVASRVAKFMAENSDFDGFESGCDENDIGEGLVRCP